MAKDTLGRQVPGASRGRFFVIPLGLSLWAGASLMAGCDGTVIDPNAGVDADQDGYTAETDCDDDDAAIHPGATDVCDDGIDQDCSGSDLACTGDTTAPTLGAGQPSGLLPAGTTQTTLRVTTDEDATCRWSTMPDTPYGSMADTFATTGGTSHETLVTGLADGQSYAYCIRCQDGAGNANAEDFIVSFSVSTDATYTITASAGPNGSISPSGATRVAAGGSQTYTITADPGYQIASLSVDGSSVGVPATYTFTDLQADHTIIAAFSVVPSNQTIAAVAAACAAEPMRGTIYYYCDCGAGAQSGCVVGDDSNAGTNPSLPRRTIEDAAAFLRSQAAVNDTVALCKGGAFDATGQLSPGSNRCPTGSACNDLREYTPTTFAGTAKPVINNSAGAVRLISFEDNVGGVRLLNLKLNGDNGALGNRNEGVFLYNGSHDVSMCNLDMDAFDIAIHSESSGSSVNSNIHVTGNYIFNSRRMGFLGAGSDSSVSHNYWEGNGSSNSYDHTIYLGSTLAVTNIRIDGNHIQGQYGPTCRGEPIVGHGSFDGVSISGNEIRLDAVADTCWGIALSHGAYPNPDYFRNTRIADNIIQNGGNAGLVISNCPDCVIENNLIIQDWAYGPGWSVTGIMIPGTASRTSPADDVNTRNLIRNNTVYFGPNSNGGAVGIKIGTEGTGHVIANNAVYYSSTAVGQGVNCFDYPLALSEYAFINNNHCYSAASPYSWVAGRGSLADWLTYSSASGFDTESFTGDPLFAAPGTEFTPGVGSPLISKGDAANGSIHDITGKVRADPPDVGAYEH